MLEKLERKNSYTKYVGCNVPVLKNAAYHYPDPDTQESVSFFLSVGDPDPEQDPNVYGPPGSESGISQRYGSRSGSFPFLINVLSRLK